MAMENGLGLKMYFLFEMGIFHGYVSLPGGISKIPNKIRGSEVYGDFPQVWKHIWEIFSHLRLGNKSNSFRTPQKTLERFLGKIRKSGFQNKLS